MSVSDILASIDHEIAQLERARAVLAGRPVVANKTTASAPLKKGSKKKRNLSPEGRKRIAEAVKRRWAAQKKSSADK